MNDIQSPLGPEHLRQIDESLRRLGHLQDTLRKCVNCGIPVEDLESDRQYLTEQLTRIKKEFYPPYSGG